MREAAGKTCIEAVLREKKRSLRRKGEDIYMQALMVRLKVSMTREDK